MALLSLSLLLLQCQAQFGERHRHQQQRTLMRRSVVSGKGNALAATTGKLELARTNFGAQLRNVTLSFAKHQFLPGEPVTWMGIEL